MTKQNEEYPAPDLPFGLYYQGQIMFAMSADLAIKESLCCALGLELNAILAKLGEWLSDRERYVIENGYLYRDGRWWTERKIMEFVDALPYIDMDLIISELVWLRELGIVMHDNGMWTINADNLRKYIETWGMYGKPVRHNRGEENDKNYRAMLGQYKSWLAQQQED